MRIMRNSCTMITIIGDQSKGEEEIKVTNPVQLTQITKNLRFLIIPRVEEVQEIKSIDHLYEFYIQLITHIF